MTVIVAKRKSNASGLSAHYAKIVTQACRIIETAEKAPALQELARTVGISPFHFQRIFTKMTGLSPKAYATAHRAKKIRAALPRTQSVTEAIYDAGYHSNGRFYAKSAQTLGMPPKTFRKGGLGATIRFAIGKCSLDFVLVAASDKGVCAIFLGDVPNELTRELQQRFPKAQLISGDRNFEKIVAKVVALVENPRLGLDLPLDIRGTAFQQRVWRALTEIPLGQTATYSEIAQRIGSPKAVRAVGGACGANPISVIIPCHRVLRTDGSLCGYHWHIDRKRALLEKEKTALL
jgi:AraC family transcriptional regulator, regulatory protein of adaptative response / methylated-DNA-[protein]-cysteine methyltransferase